MLSKHSILPVKLGFPVIVKATAWGRSRYEGSKNQEEMANAFESAKLERLIVLVTGDYLLRIDFSRQDISRFQLLADQHGNSVCLGETGMFYSAQSSKSNRRGP